MNRPSTITNEKAKNIVNMLPPKYKALFQLAIESGMRISDILNLRRTDIRRSMRIYETKSKAIRKFDISENLYNDLQNLCIFKPWGGYVFQSDRYGVKHIHRSTIHRQIKKAAAWLKIDCSAHSARKLYAQNILTDTGSIAEVQRALNHRKITTTATYLDIDLQKLTKELIQNATTKANNQ